MYCFIFELVLFKTISYIQIVYYVPLAIADGRLDISVTKIHIKTICKKVGNKIYKSCLGCLDLSSTYHFKHTVDVL